MNIATTVEHILNSLKTSPLGIFNFIPRLESLLKEIIMNQEQLKAALAEVQANQEATKATLDKVLVEVGTLVTALANTSNDLSPEVDAAVQKLIAISGELAGTAKRLDDLNPDTTTTSTEVTNPENLSGASPS